MTYELPEESFDAVAALRTRVTAANQYREARARNYIAQYEAYWQLPITHGERGLSMEQMQAVLNAGQATAIQILTDAVKEVEFIVEQNPESLPEKYRSAPYERTVSQETGIQLVSLKPEWEVPVEEEPDA